MGIYLYRNYYQDSDTGGDSFYQKFLCSKHRDASTLVGATESEGI
jgi:hypothetical protein